MMNKSKIKGSVLFTVVAVMSILTVFSMAALTLVGSANRRAHNNYANYQTQFTAKSIIDKVWNHIINDKNMSNNISALNPEDEPLVISIKGIDKSMGMGEITNANVKCIKEGMYKFSITVKLNGHENTVAAYYTANAINNFNFEYALVSLDAAGTNNADLFGPSCYGSDHSGLISVSNDGRLYGSINVNGDFSFHHINNSILKPNTGILVNDGSFTINNGGNILPIKADHPINYTDLPYIFAEKSIFPGKDVTFGSDESPVLVMTGSIDDRSETNKIYGDLYLYDDATSYLNFLGLNSWKNYGSVNSEIISNINPETLLPYTGGNIYSFGEVVYNRNTSVDFANNVNVKTLSAYSDASKNFNTTGAVVAQNVNLSGTGNFNFNGGLYTNPSAFNCSSNVIVNNVTYSRQALKAGSGSKSITIEDDAHKYWKLSTYQNKSQYSFEIDFTDFDGYEEGMIVVPTSVSVNWRDNPWQGNGFNRVTDAEFYAGLYNEYTGWDGKTYESEYLSFGKFNSYYKNPKSPLLSEIVNKAVNMSDYSKNILKFELVGGVFTDWWGNRINSGEIVANSVTINYDLYYNQPDPNAVIDFLKEVNNDIFAVRDFKDEKNNSNYQYLNLNDGYDDRYINNVTYQDAPVTGFKSCIYIDDIDKSVKIERTGGTITSRQLNWELAGEWYWEWNYWGGTYKRKSNGFTSVTTYDYNPTGSVLKVSVDYYNDSNGYISMGEFQYDDNNQYSQFLSTVIEKTTFPESMKKDNVLRADFVDNSFMKVKDEKSLLHSNAEAKATIAFSNIDETEKVTYSFGYSNSYLYADKITKVSETESTTESINLSGTSDILHPAAPAAPYEITESCTFTGTLHDAKIKIVPNGEIYIKLDDFNINNSGCMDSIIVDDSNGTVNFLLPKGKSLNVYKGNILTEYYAKDSSSISDPIKVLQNPIKYDDLLDKNVADSDMIPGINIYMEPDDESAQSIKLEQSHLTAYILIPTGLLGMATGGSDEKYFSYGEYSVNRSQSIIGAVICKQIQLSANNCFFAYVNPNPLDENTGKKLSTDMICQYYQAY